MLGVGSNSVFIQILFFFFISIICINLASAQDTGAISGIVVDASSGESIDGSVVYIYDEQGVYVDEGWVDSSGEYSVTNLLAGNYYALTGNDGDYLDEYFPDHVCGQPCYSRDRRNDDGRGDYVFFSELITVVSGETTSDINFLLRKGGGITGRLIDDETRSPIEDADLIIRDGAVNWVQRVATDDQGQFLSSSRLPAGEYYIETDDVPGYIKSGKAVNVVAGEITELDDIEMINGGKISGIVKDNETGFPLGDVWVRVDDHNGYWIDTVKTNSDGYYVTENGLAKGRYSISVSTAVNYIAAPVCPGSAKCKNEGFIDIDVGMVVEGYNLFLEKGGRVSGRVTGKETGEPIGNVAISIQNEDRTTASWTETNEMGEYISDFNLATGDYYVSASAWHGRYMVMCDVDVFCHEFSGAYDKASVSVSKGKTTEGIDIVLTKGGAINGRVVDEASGQSIAFAYVYVFDVEGLVYSSVYTDAEGYYETEKGLPAGKYYVKACKLQEDYVCEFYGGYLNFDSDIWGEGDKNTQGDSVEVGEKEVVSRINFELGKDPRSKVVLPIKVVDENTGKSLVNVDVGVSKSDRGSSYYIRKTDAFGRSVITKTLGEYFVFTSNNKGYIDEVYGSGDCDGDCKKDDFITPLILLEEASIRFVNFELAKGGSIAGRVTDKSSNPLHYAYIEVVNLQGEVVTSAFSDIDGFYRTSGGISGEHYLRLYAPRGMVGKYYADVSLSDISALSQLKSIPVLAGELHDGLDFVLEKGSILSGGIVDAETGEPIADVNLQILNRYGVVIGGAWSEPDGSFTTYSGLPNGQYYVVAKHEDYASKLFDDSNSKRLANPTLQLTL